MNQHLQAVELSKAYRLLNHGPTVLVSAQYENEQNVMAAAWACALELVLPK
jgi:flavin reductase (DIM6/NTAB) family NADH-FMN oxidoreductase RutF